MYFSKPLRRVAFVALATVALQGQTLPVQGQTLPASSLPKGWTLHAVRPGKVYVLDGGFSVSSIIIGNNGVIIVDPKIDAEAAGTMLKIVADLTPKPVTHLIETHSDCDHINGVVGFPKSVKVIAHVNNVIEQRQTLRFGTIEVGGGSGMPPADRFPDVLVRKEKQEATINGVRLVFYHYGPAHTGGDLITYLPDEKVVVAGDILMAATPGPNGLPPQNRGVLLKVEKGGSVEGWLKAADGLLALDANAYIPGHAGGPGQGVQVFTKADVRKLRDDILSDKNKLEALANAGKSLEEIKTAFNDQAYPTPNSAPPDGPVRNCPRGILNMPFTWIAYHEWLNKHNELKP